MAATLALSYSNDSVVGYLLAGKKVSTEDEEPPSIESVTRQRLVESVTD
jgi:hypothetical protein